jgi:hypothetical protein
VNSQNCQYWCTENPRLVHESPACGEKVDAWCISARKIIGPIFYNTVKAARYVNNIPCPFSSDLTEDTRLQQDTATPHMAHASLEAL